jgi:hypothetical protein
MMAWDKGTYAEMDAEAENRAFRSSSIPMTRSFPAWRYDPENSEEMQGMETACA